MHGSRIVSTVSKSSRFLSTVQRRSPSAVPFLPFSRLIPSTSPLRTASSATPKSHQSTLFEIATKTKEEFEKMKSVAEYGAWVSPITSDVAAGSDIQFAGLERDDCMSEASNTIYWLENRPAEGGRSVICSWNPKDRTIVPWTPKEFTVKTKVHEYGGGAYCVFKGVIYFVNKSDQQIYMQKSPADPPHPVTKPDPYRRFADLHYSVKFNCLLAVCEDKGDRKSAQERSEVEYQHTKAKTIPDNYIVSIDVATGDLKCLVHGADFYACPRTTSFLDGALVWMEWNIPNMPWDDTSIKWAMLNGSLSAPAPDRIYTLKADNGKTDVAFTFPEFTSNGEVLYISDEDNWWNLWKTNLAQTRKVCLERISKDLCHPLWIFGMHSYCVVPKPEKDNLLVALTYGDQLTMFKSTKYDDKEVFIHQPIPSGFFHHYYYVEAVQTGIYAIGYDAKTPMTLFYYDFASGKVTNIRSSSECNLDGYLSEPEEIEIPTTNNEVAYGYYYPPVNKDYVAPEGTAPPLLVKMHGGPTSRAYAQMKFSIQFYTSRGFGVLDVNYRGSSGYGRQFRQQLNQKWGVSDVEDAVNGAKFLVGEGKADPNRLCITGGSAGGLSVLNALLHHDTFKAGASHYGVTDLEALVAETHKFELRYLDILVGPYPATKSVYEQRSPIHNKEKLKCPVIFFQGTDDFIVPPSQSERMFEVMKAKGLPSAFVLFEGEGHGFTKKENIKKCLDTEYAFYVKVFGIFAPYVTCDVQFENV
ncbi:hypothetical protein RvY_16313 [Ramazzottius varieornatus]|uniref:Peptidase S9 prolyl oligopeptidase catalytic domain-containing protein n=1 Tax=Ramazzottius varieornatus TaxID=947166 RepID=A0A1D1W5P4_RAMVA|nr:hypothetical protein RvY_16313 [Ramazzottius varieornatus]